MMVTQSDIRRTVQSLGLEGRPVCLHTSLRSFGALEGGAEAVIDAFLDAGCTLLVPTFSHAAFAIAPPAHLHFDTNGCDYGYRSSSPERTQTVFVPDSPEIDSDMGVLPAAVLAHPEHVRGDHPLNSFTAVGPLEQLARLGGFVVLAGVGLNRMTLRHLAEQHAGRTLFRRWALGRDGEPSAVEVGSCSEGFGALLPLLESYIRRVHVGASPWQIFLASEALEIAAAAIRADPSLTHCADPGCERCRDAIAGGPTLPEGAHS